MSSPARSTLPGDPTRERLKTAAQHLFAERGIDGVSIRDIVAAAGARNGASIHYYFRTKEALIQELVLEGAQRIDLRRNAALDALEREGGPRSVAEVARLLVETSIEPAQPEGPGAARLSSYIRFINAVQVHHRQLFLDALLGRWNSGYLRCLHHLQRLLADVPPGILSQRLIFMSIYLGSTLAARETALEHTSRSDRLWRTPWALDNLVDSLCGLLSQPPSEQVLGLAARPARAQPAARSRAAQCRTARTPARGKPI